MRSRWSSTWNEEQTQGLSEVPFLQLFRSPSGRDTLLRYLPQTDSVGFDRPDDAGPDHATLARFRTRHREAISGLFSQVLGLCVAEGLVQTGVVAIDSTKVEANASAWSNRTRRQIADEILDEAEAVDAQEDEEFGDRRGDELPDKWTDRHDRRSRLREALRQLDAEGAADWESYMAEREAKEVELGPNSPVVNPAKDQSIEARPVRRTPPTLTVGCSEPGTGSFRVTTLKPQSPKTTSW